MMSFIKLLPLSFRDHYRSQWNDIKLTSKTILGKAYRQFKRPSFPDSVKEELNLHLGCGLINIPSFVNVDALPFSHVHYIRAIDNLSIFEDNTVNLIYACHCLEHFSHKKTYSILTEWFRCLKKGGILRVSVPDFDLLLKIYSVSNNDIESILYPLIGGHTNRWDFHMSVFTKKSLEHLLKDVGFSKVREWQPGMDNLTTLNDYSSFQIIIDEISYPVSLNLEAVK